MYKKFNLFIIINFILSYDQECDQTTFVRDIIESKNNVLNI